MIFESQENNLTSSCERLCHAWCSCEESARKEKLDCMFWHGFKHISDDNLDASLFATDGEMSELLLQCSG